MSAPAAEEEFRVLVVDDNEDSAKTMGLLLRMWGFSSRHVFDSQEAVAVAEEFLPHCIITDLRMPKLDGYQLAREFRRHSLFETTPLIANSATPDERRVAEAGFNYSLVKPQSALVIGEILKELQSVKKKLGDAEAASRHGTEVVTEVRDLMKEVRDDVKEIKVELRHDVEQLKSDLREVKEDVKELRDQRSAEGDAEI